MDFFGRLFTKARMKKGHKTNDKSLFEIVIA